MMEKKVFFTCRPGPFQIIIILLDSNNKVIISCESKANNQMDVWNICQNDFHFFYFAIESPVKNELLVTFDIWTHGNLEILVQIGIRQ